MAAKNNTHPCIQETNIALINLTMENIDKELKSINTKLDNMEVHYANKWVEKVMIWLMTSIWLSLLGAIMALIIK